MNRIKKDTSVHQEPNPGDRENREHPAWDEEEHVGERKSLILFIVEQDSQDEESLHARSPLLL